MSIWDQPVPAGASKTATPDLTNRAVPMMPAALRGETTHGPLSTLGGYGVYQGRPYGVQLQTEETQLTAQYRFRPGDAARLRAATNSALGR